MRSYPTRTASILLAFGFFFISACSTLFQSQQSLEQAYAEGDDRQVLTILNRQLEDEPGNEELLLQKALTLDRLAMEQEHPDQREPYYRNMRQILESLDYSPNTATAVQRDSLIATSWEREQMKASALYSTIENPSPAEQQLIGAHFENALIIDPETSDSYLLKTNFHYQYGELESALRTLRKAEEYLDPMPFDMQEKFAFLLLEEGELKQAIDHYLHLKEHRPDNHEVDHGLVNAYILDGQHEHSIALLHELLEREPENVTYHQALATEIFFLVESKIEHIASGTPYEGSIDDLHSELTSYLSEAEEHYRIVREHHPDPDEITFITAAFYKNTAAHLMRLAETSEPPLSDELIDKANELLTRSIPVWQEIAERHPENSDIWRSMYQIYTHLGMSEEAEEAESRANL